MRSSISTLAVAGIGTAAMVLVAGAAEPSRSQMAMDTVPIPEVVARAWDAGTRHQSGRPGDHYWQLRPHYELQAVLSPSARTLRGEGAITVRSPSSAAWHEIVLRLDQNRFLLQADPPVATSGLEITSLQVDGEPIPLDSERITGLRTTVVRVRLGDPVEPGATTTLDVKWTLEIPEAERGSALRSGSLGGSIFQVGQWYPRLSMYDDLAGWDTAPHHPELEFYNPFATFEVSIDVPAGWLVGATGTLQNPREMLSAEVLERLRTARSRDTTLLVLAPEELGRGTRSAAGRQVWRFHANTVSDFAWGASADYAWATTSRSREGRERLLVHALLADRTPETLTREAARGAELLMAFSGMLFPYAWDEHTIVSGPEPGMEYPMLTMAGRASAHEMAHQWFPMMVGSDETRFVFMDEGFATFLALLARPEDPSLDGPGRATPVPMLLPEHDFRTRRVLAATGYWRGRDMMQALVARSGRERVREALSEYASRWRFHHPTPWDFMASMETALGTELDRFWLTWLFETDEVDPPG